VELCLSIGRKSERSLHELALNCRQEPEIDLSAQSRLAVLSVSPAAEDAAVLGRICQECGWSFHVARTCAEAAAVLRQVPVQVVISDRHLPDGTWRNVLAAGAGCDPAPAVIVASRTADDRLWAEVLNLGGCDVLAKPFERKEILWSVRSASQHHASAV
jgi:DNA-binding response OmpR family regulator